jgi:hypothetical protein
MELHALLGFIPRTRNLLLRGLIVSVASVGSAGACPFADNFESGPGPWTAQSPWGLTTARYASPTHAATDSPGAFLHQQH